ncbi:hypothetical protein BJY04DRAFT_213458 [Aspergillus karnatakaensis]|uniref:uncharacterized protein n=1 Tax=Aspergillus karnatakaensis TaxID=1810916 RepID=UPI003CCD48F0
MELLGPTSVPTFKATCKARVAQLLQYLESVSDPYINLKELPNGLVTILDFNALDEEFLATYQWLFTPMPAHLLASYGIDYKRTGSIQLSLQDFPSESDPINELAPGMRAPHQRAILINRSLDRLFGGVRRLKIRKLLQQHSGWQDISYGHPFLWRMALIDKVMPISWGSMIYEHVSKDEITSPHIMLMTVQSVDAAEDQVLTGELGPIISAIANRLEQAEFADVNTFPVMQVSLCGPQHGRILQGCYTRAGVFEIWKSQLFSFMRVSEAPFDLFLRFLANTPRNPTREVG